MSDSTQGPTPTALALRTLLQAGSEVGPAVARRAALTHSELLALEVLVERPTGPADLARELHVTTAASSGIVDRLEGHGHAVRRPHPTDRRRTEVHLTDSGRDEVLGHLRPMLDALRELDAGLSDDDRAVVTAYLRGATEAVRRLL